MTSGSRHSAFLLAAGLVAAGFVLLFLGWKGGAATLFVPSQVAFGMSGGMVGVALIGTGLAVATAHLTRLGTARRSLEMQRVIGDTVDIVARIRERTSDGTQPLPIPLPQPAPPVADVAALAPAPSANGHTAPVAITEPQVLLVAGGRTYHGATCRIVSDPETALRLTVGEAEAAGLRACRVCGGGA